MKLRMRTFKEILEGMANWITTNSDKVTNFHVGSVIRTLLEAVAMQIESLYFQMHKGFKDAIENSIFHSFDFYKHEALPATGMVTIKFRAILEHHVVIPKGFQFSTLPSSRGQVYYEATEEVKVPYGVDTIDVPVVCTEAGEIGNVSPYSVRVAVTPLPFMQEVYNSSPFVTGMKEESKASRKKRFSSYIETLSRGTVGAVQYGCLKVEGVTGAYVDESVGFINVYVHNSEGELPEELRQKVLRSLLDYRSAGIGVNILPVIKKNIDLSIDIQLNLGYDNNLYESIIQNSIESHLNHFTVSNPLIRAQLLRFVMSIDENAIANAWLNVEGDIHINRNELIRAGIIRVNIIQER